MFLKIVCCYCVKCVCRWERVKQCFENVSAVYAATLVSMWKSVKRHGSEARGDKKTHTYMIHVNHWLFSVLGNFQQFCQLYNGLSCVSYQYYWSIYPGTSQSAVMLTQQPCALRKAAIITIYQVFGMTLPGIRPATSRTRGGRSTTAPPRRFHVNHI